MSHDLMSLDTGRTGGDRSPLIETDEIMTGDDEMSILDEKIVGADDVDSIMEKHMPVLPDLEVTEIGHHEWHIQDWRALERKTYSESWLLGGFRWRILLFPQGNTQPDSCAAYLECLPENYDENVAPEDQPEWSACAQFMIVMWNKNDPTIYHDHVASHRFTNDESDWGFSRLYDIRKLGYNHMDKNRPILESGETMISCYIRLIKDPTGVLWHNFNNYDSKKATGYVGLKNQGATCYMNSLLQSLYFTSYFRKAVYQIPTENDEPGNSIALSLQRIFYQMDKASDPASTLELTQSFGWSSLDAFMQHDVQEFNRVLQDNLEGKMKKTQAENALSRLFVGKMKSYIKCVNVDYESAREEEFWDIQLNVKGMKNLRDSFRDYVQVETLDGDNKYFAEGFGLQDAKKGVIFQEFPPVLHLQLKRFEYDMERDAMVKINDRHEFPLEIDLEEFLDETANHSENWNYKLHGVLVHSGDLHGGHYYALLKPEKDGNWFRFDDDRVTPALTREVLDENFGGLITPSGIRNPNVRQNQMKRFMNAYMLVYVRETRIDEILMPVTDADIPIHVSKRIEAELEEEARKKKEREEAHLFLHIKTITREDFAAHDGFDMADLTSPELQTRKVLKDMTYGEFKQIVAKEQGVDISQIRHWIMVHRQNKTVRPDAPLAASYDTRTLADVRDEFAIRRTELLFYLEIVDRDRVQEVSLVDGHPDSPKFMLFIKYFDVDAQTLSGLGTMYLEKHDKIEHLAEILAKRLHIDGVAVKLFEEIKPGMIEPLRFKTTFSQAEIVDGDIVCVQRTVTELERSSLTQLGKFAHADHYYDFCHNKVTVKIIPRFIDADINSKFDLVLSRKMQYEAIANKIADVLKVQASHLRLSTVNSVTQQPKQTIKPTATLTLQSILQPAYLQSQANALAYEVLETTLRELELKKLLKIYYLPEGLTKEVPVELLVAKNGNIEDAINLLAAKLQLSANVTPNIRIYEAHSNKYYKEYEPTHPVSGIQDYMILYAELVTDIDARESETDREIPVMHFQKEPSRSHGIPFKFILKEGEYWSQCKKRLQAKTQYKDDDFKKIKGCMIQASMYSRPVYFSDEDVPYDLIKGNEDMLGIDHMDKTVKPARYGERAIKISG